MTDENTGAKFERDVDQLFGVDVGDEDDDEDKEEDKEEEEEGCSGQDS